MQLMFWRITWAKKTFILRELLCVFEVLDLSCDCYYDYGLHMMVAYMIIKTSLECGTMTAV